MLSCCLWYEVIVIFMELRLLLINFQFHATVPVLLQITRYIEAFSTAFTHIWLLTRMLSPVNCQCTFRDVFFATQLTDKAPIVRVDSHVVPQGAFGSKAIATK